MSNLGDFHAGCTLYDMFTTTDTVGRPSLLTGNPAPTLVAYRNAFFSCSTAGLTLAINCNGLLGVQGWSVNTNSDPAFYACGNQYQVLLRGGCVTTSLIIASPQDSVCVSGYVVGRFSLDANSSLRPLIHGCNRVATTSTGAVRINWAEIENKATAEALSCTTLFSVQSVINSVGIPDCTAIFSVHSVDNAIGVLPDTILDQAIAQPAAIFSWPGSLRTILAWLGAVASNKIVQEAGQQGVCNRAGTVTVGTAVTTDDGTSATRGSFT